MKKYIIVPSALILIGLLSLNFALDGPGSVVVAHNIKANQAGLHRTITNEKWWPTHAPKFNVHGPLLNGADIIYISNGDTAKGNVLLAPIKNDSTLIRWETTVPPHSDLSGWLGNYLNARQLHADVESALAQLARFASDNVNIYGRRVHQTTMKDSVMFITRFNSPDTPSMELLYDRINSIRQRISSHGLKETSHPMAHVSKSDSGFFKCMVAVPVNRSAPINDKNISLIRMVPGRFISTEVTGGPKSIQGAYNTIEQYMEDYKRTAVALPFEYLVTDRLATPDTAKWKTIIYAPVY